MADASWGYAGPVEASNETGLADVLTAFATYGGQLWGARRWVENPLMLTHVRWQGPSGQFLDAMRRPGDDAFLTPGERAAWVEVALHYPTVAAPMMSGTQGPWVALSVDPATARTWLATMPRPRPQSGTPSTWLSQPSRPPASPDWSSPTSNPRPPTSPPFRPSYGPRVGASPDSQGLGPNTSSSQNAWAWPAERGTSVEFSVIPCVEIELAPDLGAGVAADYARDYANDVALHFARAARTLPQVRELRGWVRGDRFVLAARMVTSTGRPPTQADMDSAAQLLADALAQRTLPYARLTFAEPADWQSGTPLPE